jgi:hypothetical protein
MTSRTYAFSIYVTIFMITSLACGQGIFNPSATATISPTKTVTPVPPTPTSMPPTATATSTSIPYTSTPILATPDITFRRISLNELKGNSLLFDFPIELDIPSEYVIVNNDYTEYTQFVWMPGKYATSYQGIASAETDYLDVNTSTNVGYDPETNTFFGIPYTDVEKTAVEEALEGNITRLEQGKVGEFPTMVFEISNLPADKYSGFTKLNILYIGTTVGTMTIMIRTYSSPENFIRNEFIWARLKTSLSTTK